MYYVLINWFVCFVVLLGTVSDNFLLVSDPFRQSLHQLNLADESVWTFSLTSKKINYVAYDPVEMKVYWVENRVIQRARLIGTGGENITPRNQGNSYLYIWWKLAVRVRALNCTRACMHRPGICSCYPAV